MQDSSSEVEGLDADIPDRPLRVGRELDEERERVEQANERRAARRGYLVFATDPDVHPDEPGYREVFATEAKTPAQAIREGPAAGGRPAAAGVPGHGHYSDELAEARWVA